MAARDTRRLRRQPPPSRFACHLPRTPCEGGLRAIRGSPPSTAKQSGEVAAKRTEGAACKAGGCLRASGTSRFWRRIFQRVSNNLNNLHRQNRPIPDTGVPHFETCRRMPSSIPHGGRLYTVQRRGVDAGEREEPGRTMPVGREFMRSRGRLASTSPAGCPSCRGGPWLNIHGPHAGGFCHVGQDG